MVVSLPVSKRKFPERLLIYSFVLLLAVFLFFASLRPNAHRQTWESRSMQMSREIALAMFAYSNDNNQNYPDGKSSTEVFQKLLDGHYVGEPSAFYLPLPGKMRPLPGQKLKPENVCFDVTSGIDSSSPDGLPIVFMTGYKVNYVPGGAAIPLLKPYPNFADEPPAWFDWWGLPKPPGGPVTGIAVTYKSNNARFMHFETSATLEKVIPNILPPDFNANGKTYRQLTPDGPLP
jgi:hypothetical protein